MSSESEAADKPMDPAWLPLSVREAIRKGDPGPVGEFVGRFRSALATERKARSEAEAKLDALDNWRCIGESQPAMDCEFADMDEKCVACAAHALVDDVERKVDSLIAIQAERDALKAELERVRESLAALKKWVPEAATPPRAQLLEVHDALHASCDGTVDLPTEIRVLRAQVEEMRRALEEIADPVAHVQRKAKAAGDVINGVALVSLSKDPYWPRQRAKDALAALSTPKEPQP